MTLLCSVELRNTTTRNATYHVDLQEVGGEYFTVIRYGAIGKGLTTKKGTPFSNIRSAASDYEAKVKAKLQGEYKHYAGDLSVPQRVLSGARSKQPASPQPPKSRTKVGPATQSAAQILAAALARKPPLIQSSRVTGTPDDEDVVYDDL